MTIANADLIGAWNLIAWSIDYPEGRRTIPFQPDPQGLLIYAAEGVMSAVIHSGRRPVFSSGDPRRLTHAEKAAAFDSYFHYSGAWRVEGDDVVHTVDAALNPNMIGTSQVRHVRLVDSQLELSAEEELDRGRGIRRHVLKWQRVLPKSNAGAGDATLPLKKS
jgi:hypothetical protein